MVETLEDLYLASHTLSFGMAFSMTSASPAAGAEGEPGAAAVEEDLEFVDLEVRAISHLRCGFV